MVESLVNWFTTHLTGLVPSEVIIFIISMVPILELRGGLIAARVLDVNLIAANIICVIGNMIPVPFILFFITPIFNWMKKFKIFRPIAEYFEKKALGKKDALNKGIFWGLLLFVGIPLPGTGAWTGSLLASMMGIEIKKSAPPIMLGVVLAAAIMSIVTYFIPWVISMF